MHDNVDAHKSGKNLSTFDKNRFVNVLEALLKSLGYSSDIQKMLDDIAHLTTEKDTTSSSHPLVDEFKQLEITEQRKTLLRVAEQSTGHQPMPKTNEFKRMAMRLKIFDAEEALLFRVLNNFYIELENGRIMKS